MIVRLVRVITVAALPFLMLAAPGAAQTASPAPTAAPAPTAFVAHAHANVSVVVQGAAYAGTATFGVAARANLIRIDLLSFKSDALPLPPISLTAVIDRGANTLTLWSDTTKTYRVQPFIPRAPASPAPASSATPSPAPRRGTSPFSKLEVFEMSMKLTGHGMVAGVPATGLSFEFQTRNQGDKNTFHVVATTQLADEYSAFPLAIDLTAAPGPVPFLTLRYAVDDLTRGASTTRFEIPAGYTEASSLPAVIFQRRSP